MKRYAAASGSTWAIDIAWNALFAFFPIILTITTVLSLIVGASSNLSATIYQDIQRALPEQGAALTSALQHYHQAAGILAVVSFVGLLWSGSSLFSAMDQGLDALYPTKQRSFVRQKLMGLVMIAVFTVLILLAVGTAALLPILHDVQQLPGFLRSGPVALLIQIGFGVLDGVLLFGAIYLIVPNRPHKVREIVPGAIAAAVLFEAFTLLFPLYFKLEHGFGTYGTTFALFFLLMTFAYWMAQIVMLGGAVNAELHPPEPGSFPRAGSSISPNAQADADRAELQGAPATASAGQRARSG